MSFRSLLPSLHPPSTQRPAAQPSQRMSSCSRHPTASSSATSPAHLRSPRARHPSDTLALASASALTVRLSDERLPLLALAASPTLSLATTERSIDGRHPRSPSSMIYTTYDCDTAATLRPSDDRFSPALASLNYCSQTPAVSRQRHARGASYD